MSYRLAPDYAIIQIKKNVEHSIANGFGHRVPTVYIYIYALYICIKYVYNTHTKHLPYHQYVRFLLITHIRRGGKKTTIYWSIHAETTLCTNNNNSAFNFVFCLAPYINSHTYS